MTTDQHPDVHGGSPAKLITNPAELAAAYGLAWPADACTCCGGKIVDSRCLGADKCEPSDLGCAGLDEEASA